MKFSLSSLVFFPRTVYISDINNNNNNNNNNDYNNEYDIGQKINANKWIESNNSSRRKKTAELSPLNPDLYLHVISRKDYFRVCSRKLQWV